MFGESHSRVPLVNRQRDLFLPTIALDRASPTPLLSRNTVLSAYDELFASGLIRGRRGAGMTVATGSRVLAPFDPDGTELYLSFR